MSALILLGGWGLCASLYQIKQSWHEYESSTELVAWSEVGGLVIKMAQHLAYERGRMAVVLKEPQPVSDSDRAFIEKRRRLANDVFKELESKVLGIPRIGYQDFVEKWDEIQSLRRLVDKESVLPLARRDPRLPSRWIKETTSFLTQIGMMAKDLARHYHQTEEAHRLNIIGLFSYRLRLSAGSEASMIAQHIASHTPISLQEMMLVHEMRGAQDVMWREIERNTAYVGNPALNEVLAHLRMHRDKLRRLQDEVMLAWRMRRPVKVTKKALIDKSVPYLDGISDFVLQASHEANQLAQTRMRLAKQVLLAYVATVVLMLIVMMLAIFYVVRNVVEPLEVVDEKLRRIHFIADDSNYETNQIERLTHTAETLERLFERKKRLEGELRELAFYDQLTHLPNRRLIEDRLQQHIARAKRQKSFLALLFIDLDHFKPINDDFGHETGDWVLRMVADRIIACIRESDAAARIGGDEFVVLLPDLLQTDAALMVAEKIRDQLSQPFFMPNGQQFNISSSIGIAVYPIHAQTVEELMRVSDEAMYEAKNAGRDRVVIASDTPA